MEWEDEFIGKYYYGKGRWLYYNDRLKVALIEIPRNQWDYVSKYIYIPTLRSFELNDKVARIEMEYNDINEVFTILNSIEFIILGDKKFAQELLKHYLSTPIGKTS